MKEPRVVQDVVRAPQLRASNPQMSAFVSANAGAGKTHVLVNRVIRLLLDGTPPEKILCITFTKAAAANMAERVFDTLGHWISLDDAQLDQQLVLAGVPHPDARLRARARELFSCTLETPGGLKVQTIHALCTRLLQQFPFEANVPARFAVLDDRDQFEIMERSILAVLLDAAAKPQSEIGKALATAITSSADRTFRDVVQDACLGNTALPAMDRRGMPAGRWRNSIQPSACEATSNSPTSSVRSWTDPICRYGGGLRSQQCWTAAAQTIRNRRKRCAQRTHWRARRRSKNISACS